MPQSSDLNFQTKKIHNSCLKRAKMVVITSFALIVIMVLPALWLGKFLVFLPFLLVARAIKRPSLALVGAGYAPKTTGYKPDKICFDRFNDISKINGCNTRGVKYRWTLFSNEVANVKVRVGPTKTPLALDFGAGSLRDTHELFLSGFEVTSLDLDKNSMSEGLKYFDWSGAQHKPKLVHGNLDSFKPDKKFDIILAFDVIEHLAEPEVALITLREILEARGSLLITVPNRRALWEIIRKKTYERHRRQGRADLITGRPHIQFRSPAEWSRFFSDRGFVVTTHDMAIGFLVNDLWVGFYSALSVIILEPGINPLLKSLRSHIPPFFLQNILCPPWLMELVNLLDIIVKPIFRPFWGWNLFVLNRNDDTSL